MSCWRSRDNTAFLADKVPEDRIYTGQQCWTKWRSLEQRYKTYIDARRDGKGTTGTSADDLPEFEWVEAVGEILGNDPHIQPLPQLGTHPSPFVDMTSETDLENEISSPSLASCSFSDAEDDIHLCAEKSRWGRADSPKSRGIDPCSGRTGPYISSILILSLLLS